MLQSKTFNRLFAFLIICITVYLKFGEIIPNLNTTLFALHGDGFRAYFMAKYHLLYDTSYLHTSAFNYPFGEHIVYTDSQPLIIGLLKLLYPIIDLSGYTVAILNGFMITGFILSIVFSILILKKFQLPIWIGALIGAGMVLLSPQTGRFTGHYSLSYMFVVPAILYCLLLLEEKKLKSTSLWMLLFGLFLAGTHMYLFAMYAGAVLLYWLFWGRKHFLTHKKDAILAVVLQFILPITIYTILMGTTDYISDRPSYPKGFFIYNSHPAVVFFPIHKPYLSVFNRITSAPITWEGYAYISLVVTTILSFLSYRYLRTVYYTKFRKRVSFFENPVADMLLLISILFLLYSFTIPFNLDLHWLLKYTGPLRQIRAVGRFSWVFYYTVIPLAFAWLYKQKFTIKNIRVDRFIFFATLILFLAEGKANYKLGRSINHQFEAFTNESTQYDSLINKINKEHYQSIYPLPFFYVGPEYLGKNGTYDFIRYSYLLSIKCDIPLAANFCARTSYSQAFEQVEHFRAILRVPHIFSRYTDERILLIADNSKKLEPLEQTMFQSATTIGKLGEYILLETSTDTINKYASILAANNLMSLDSVSYSPIYNDPIKYTQKFSIDNVLQQKPIIISRPVKEKIVLSHPLPDSVSGPCNLYLWMGAIDQDRMLGTDFYVKTYDKNNELIADVKQTALYYIHSLVDNNALLIFKEQQLSPGGRLELTVKNNQLTKQQVTIYNVAYSMVP